MMRLFLLLLPAALTAAEQRQGPPFELPAGVEMQRDVVYSKVGARELRLDLFLPRSGAGPFPAVVYIHGGGWQNGSRKAFERHAAYMAARGFAGACIEYRLSGEARYPAAVHDSKAAVRWVRANAAKLRIDAKRIGAAGGSAGGHLAAMLGTTGGIARLAGEGGNPSQSSAVQSVAAFNPAVDLVSFGQLATGNAEISVAKFLGQSYAQAPDLWAEATPITHVNCSSAPTLFLHGDADTTVPYAQSLKMMEKLRAAGVRTEMHTAKGAAHGFFNRPPFYQPALESMECWFRETLGAR